MLSESSHDMTLFQELNDDIHLLIFSFLTVNDLLKFQFANKHFCQLTETDLPSWKIHYYSNFLPLFSTKSHQQLPIEPSQLTTGYKKEIIRVFRQLQTKANETQQKQLSTLKKQNNGGFPFLTTSALLTQYTPPSQQGKQMVETLGKKSEDLKCVFVGERNVGKTCKLLTCLFLN